MRTTAAVQVISIAVIAATVALCIHARTTAIALQNRIAVVNARHASFLTLQEERDRLRSELTEVILRQRARDEASAVSRARPMPVPAHDVLSKLGEWSASGAWRNEGRATPTATIATLLWAAAGGDLATVGQTIAFDEAGRKRAQDFFDRLPPAARRNFQSPEALVASLTVEAVPDNAAQLSWIHQRDPDHVTAALLLRSSEHQAPSDPFAVPPKGNQPIMLAGDPATKLAVLSLERSSSGWHIIVPAAAIDRLARSYLSSAKPE